MLVGILSVDFWTLFVQGLSRASLELSLYSGSCAYEGHTKTTKIVCASHVVAKHEVIALASTLESLVSSLHICTLEAAEGAERLGISVL